MRRKLISIGVVVCVVALVAATLTIAQPPARGDRGGQGAQGQQGPGQRRGQFDPAQMRQRMTERMKEQLGASDAEWKVIEPRLMKVMELNRQASGFGRGGMFFGNFAGRGPRGGEAGQGPGGDRPRPQGQEPEQMSAVEKAAEQLRTTLENQSASPEEIVKQMTALRQAREKARQELATAQQELKQILTPRQEAQLMLMQLLN